MFSDAKIELLGDGGNTDGISPGADDVMVKIYFDEKSGEYKIRPSLSDNSNIEADECRNAAEAVLSAFEKARINAAGISDNQLLSLTADTDVTVDTVKDYISASDSDLSTQYSVQIIYSVVTMMLCIMAASYIVRSVAEEKASKLIDTLLISTKPLVLVFGKILAVMAYVFGYDCRNGDMYAYFI